MSVALSLTIIPSLCIQYGFNMCPCPVADGGDGDAKGGTKGGQGVFDAGRHFGVNGAGNDAIPFQAAQVLGQHFLGDAFDGAAQFGEPFGSVFQQADDEDGPFVGDKVKYLARGAVVGIGGGGIVRGGEGDGFHKVTIALSSAVLHSGGYSLIVTIVE